MKAWVVAAVLGMAGASFAGELWVDQSAPAGGDGTAAKPFQTVTDAVKAAAGPGDTVVIKAGVYREQLPKLPSGAEGQPFTIKSAPGERATISGSTPVAGWQKGSGNAYTAAIDRLPKRVLLNNRELPNAREPNDGWWVASAVTPDSITDAEHVPGLDADPAGGTAYVWLQKGNSFGNFQIEQRNGPTLALKPARRRQLSANDKYYLKNKPEFVDRPGEWVAVAGEDGKITLHLWPDDEADLRAIEIPGAFDPVIPIDGASYIVIDSLNITGGLKDGINAKNVKHLTVSNCVLYHNLYMALTVKGGEDITISRCVSVRNEYGIAVGESRRAVIEECEVAFNGTDGVLITWNSDDVTLRKSYIHDHMLWGHPDNVQTYRNVKGFKMQDNLLLTSGQSLMMEETTGGELSGNTIIGSGAYMVIFGHGNTNDFDIRNNTFAFPGYGAMNLTGDQYRVKHNIFMTGHTKPAYGTKGVEGYVGEGNVFWSGQRVPKNAHVMASDKGFHRSFQQFQEATGQDTTSVFADPQFRNAPIGSAVLDGKKLPDSTASRLFLGGNIQSFKAGDNIEINFDGVKRKVRAVEGTAIVIDPPLAEKPTKAWLVANWGPKTDYTLDLRPGESSPAATLMDGKPVGSSVDIQAYKRGDFNADGRRDLPEVPKGLLPSEQDTGGKPADGR